MSTLGRMVVIIWLFVVLIINSSYTASLTSILTVQPLSSTIKGIDSLKAGDEPRGYQVSSYAEHYLADDVGISKSRLVDLGSPEKYAKALQLGPENGGVAAIVDERPYVEIFLSTQCSFRIVVGQEFTRSGWGFAFPRDSPLATDLSTAILQLSENGDLPQIYDKWLVGRACSTDYTEIDSDRLRFKIFWDLFIICGIACIVALCIYFWQIMLQLRHSAPTAQPSSSNGSSSVSRHLRRFISLIDEKEEQSNNSSKKRVESKRLPEKDGLRRQLKRLQTETSQTSSQFSFRVQK